VWDNFGFDPATGHAMITTAGNAARKHRLDRREVEDLAFCRYQQYFETKASEFLDRVLVPLEVLDVQGRFSALSTTTPAFAGLPWTACDKCASSIPA